MKYLFSLLLLLFMNVISAQSRFYVHASASGLNSGQNWSDAFTDFQSALQSALSGDEIWVAEGTYYPGNNRSLSFEPKSGVKVFGGFAGYETALSQRDWSAHATVLSGDIGITGDSTDNSYNVMYLHLPDSNTIVDGFTIRDGNANLTGSDSLSRPIAGGGLYIYGYNAEAYPEIRNCSFIRNTAVSNGGGVLVYGHGTGSVAPRFINCRFERNRAGNFGGGIAQYGSSAIERGDDLLNCVFFRNKADAEGGGYYYVDSEQKDYLNIHGCRFEENTASFEGAGVSLSIGRETPAGFTIVGCSFERNTAHNGAAFSVRQNVGHFIKYFVVDSCVFRGNIYKNYDNTEQKSVVSIQQFGIGVNPRGYFRNSIIENNTGWNSIINLVTYRVNLLCENLVLRKNQASERILGIYLDQETLLKNAVFTENIIQRTILAGYSTHVNEKLSVVNCRFEKNVSTVPAAYIEQSTGHLNIINCLFARNNIQLIAHSSSAVKLATNCILEDIGNKTRFLSTTNRAEYRHCYIDNINCITLTLPVACGPGNITLVDPMFRDKANGDYSLLPCSPLIDAGSNDVMAGISTDANGAARIQGGIVDIGLYETAPLTLSGIPVVSPACQNAQNGSISIQLENGCEPYNYEWLPFADNSGNIGQLSPGAYRLTVTDANGRQFQDTIQVPEMPVPALSPVTQNIVCGALSGGSATVSVSGGSPPFQFAWNTGAGDSLLNKLPAGQYKVSVTDKNGCRNTAEMSISLSGQLTLSVSGEVISCSGASDAILSAKPVNGQPPFRYLWSPNGNTDSLLTDLGAGIYTITATDFYGCSSSFTFTVYEPVPIQVLASAIATTSVQNPNGSASAGASGGTQPYIYLWNNGAQTPVITNLAPGIYTVTVTDAHGCTTTADTEVSLLSSTNEAPDALIKVWPNPMQQQLEISMSDQHAGDYRFILRNALGEMLAEESLQAGSASLFVSKLPAGIYFWELQGEDGRLLKSGKLLK